MASKNSLQDANLAEDTPWTTRSRQQKQRSNRSNKSLSVSDFRSRIMNITTQVMNTKEWRNTYTIEAYTPAGLNVEQLALPDGIFSGNVDL
jgi:hypothetical protein